MYTYTYDNEGNRLTQTTIVGGSVTAYTWDNRNRLTEVDHYASSAAYAAKTSDWSVQYTYDYLDRQIQRKVDSNGSAAGGVDYFYNVYQGDDVALEIEDPDGLGAGTSPHVAYRYLDGQAVDEVLASETENSSGTPTSVLWGLGDNEGTIRDLVDNATKAVVDHRTYDSFGNVKEYAAGDLVHPITTGPLAGAFTFSYTGQSYDMAVGLFYDQARWYDSRTGRFMSEDPAAADPNLYRYCGNNPMTNTDPTGLCGNAYNGGMGSCSVLNSGGVPSLTDDLPDLASYFGGSGLNIGSGMNNGSDDLNAMLSRVATDNAVEELKMGTTSVDLSPSPFADKPKPMPVDMTADGNNVIMSDGTVQPAMYPEPPSADLPTPALPSRTSASTGGAAKTQLNGEALAWLDQNPEAKYVEQFPSNGNESIQAPPDDYSILAAMAAAIFGSGGNAKPQVVFRGTVQRPVSDQLLSAGANFVYGYTTADDAGEIPADDDYGANTRVPITNYRIQTNPNRVNSAFGTMNAQSQSADEQGGAAAAVLKGGADCLNAGLNGVDQVQMLAWTAQGKSYFTFHQGTPEHPTAPLPYDRSINLLSGVAGLTGIKENPSAERVLVDWLGKSNGAHKPN